MPNAAQFKLYLKDYKCHAPDCGVLFSCEWNQTVRPYCPKCGDNAEVLRHPKQVRKKLTKRPRWTDEQKTKLLHTYQLTTLNYRQIGEIFGKTESSVYQMIKRLKVT